MAGKRKVHTAGFSRPRSPWRRTRGMTGSTGLAGRLRHPSDADPRLEEAVGQRGAGIFAGPRPRGPRLTPRPARPNCSSRSADSRWSWSG